MLLVILKAEKLLERFAKKKKTKKKKKILAKGSVPNGSEEVFMIKKIIKTLCYGHMLLVILTEEKLVESFRKKNCRKQIKKSLELKKQLKEKMINHTLNGKATIILLTVVNDVMCKCVNE